MSLSRVVGQGCCLERILHMQPIQCCPQELKEKMSAILLITYSTLYSNLLSIQQSNCEQGIQHPRFNWSMFTIFTNCLPALITGTPMAPESTVRFHNRMPFLPLSSQPFAPLSNLSSQYKPDFLAHRCQDFGTVPCDQNTPCPVFKTNYFTLFCLRLNITPMGPCLAFSGPQA